MLQDIVSDINCCGLGEAVLPLDQEKAFDGVDWASSRPRAHEFQCALSYTSFPVLH